MIIRPSHTVLGGAAIGLVAGIAVYGAVTASSAGPVASSLKPARVSAAEPAAIAAGCSAGQELEHGVCVVHVERIVVGAVPAAASASAPTISQGSGSGSGAVDRSGPSASSDHATEGDHLEAAEAAADATNDHGSDGQDSDGQGSDGQGSDGTGSDHSERD